ncbi:hypothetical protein JOF53_008246 [Crossiella equi]|uniref:Uncharacterized protein n=1 Tax=Crossiella equi TaxID=130796 RepID=A0ABS5AS28_9PSEU|nr:hypothetical protein [Crossiella equi]MBP2479374.1 hypothetical protein [Crossiella equi]
MFVDRLGDVEHGTGAATRPRKLAKVPPVELADARTTRCCPQWTR